MKKRFSLSAYLNNYMERLNKASKFKLKIEKRSKFHLNCSFVGVNDRIKLRISDTTAEIWYYFNENDRELLMDFSVYAELDSDSKYYCRECKSPNYKTLESLYNNHFIKPFIQWQKGVFKKENYIVYYTLTKFGGNIVEILNFNEFKRNFIEGSNAKVRKKYDLHAVEKVLISKS